MAIQVVPNNPSFGGNIGSILGSGIGQGLSMLAQNKMKEIQNQKMAKSWESIGVPTEYANFLVQQPEWVQKEILSRLEGLGGSPQQSMMQGQPQAQQQGMQQSLGGVQQASAQSQQPSSGVRLGKSSEQKKEEQHKFKETKEFRHSLLESKRAAKQDLKDLGRLEELSSSGKLATPGYVEFLSRAGLDIPALSTPESEEFQKIQANFLRNAKQYFGGRISNYEVEQFLKTIPSLSQSPEGRSRVIANLKHIARGAEERYKAYEDVLKENRGTPPLDLEEQVENKVEKRLDRIYEQFRKDLSKPVPKGQSKIITALQAAAGSTIKPAGAALTGAAIGSVVPGIGTLAGGAAGGLAGIGAKLSGLI